MRREEDPEENPDNCQHLRSRKKEPNKETEKEPPESEDTRNTEAMESSSVMDTCGLAIDL